MKAVADCLNICSKFWQQWSFIVDRNKSRVPDASLATLAYAKLMVLIVWRHCKVAGRCDCECVWLFISKCQYCNELAACPGCTLPSPSVGFKGVAGGAPTVMLLRHQHLFLQIAINIIDNKLICIVYLYLFTLLFLERLNRRNTVLKTWVIIALLQELPSHNLTVACPVMVFCLILKCIPYLTALCSVLCFWMEAICFYLKEGKTRFLCVARMALIARAPPLTVIIRKQNIKQSICVSLCIPWQESESCPECSRLLLNLVIMS